MSKLKNIVPLLCATVLLLLGIWYLWIYQGIRYSFTETEPNLEGFYFIDLVEDEPVISRFVATNHYLEGIKLVLVNLTDEREGTVTASLLSADGELLAEASRELESIEIGAWEFFPLQSRVSVSEYSTIMVELSDANESPYIIGKDGDIALAYRYAKEGSTYEKTIITALLIFLAMCCAWASYSRFSALIPWKRAIGLFLLLAQFIFYIPNIAYKLAWINLDDSWRYFLNIAGYEGYIFGKDIFFTYGPLGYLCYMMNLPNNGMTFLVGIVIWCIIIAIYLFLLHRIYRLFINEKISLISLGASTLCALASYIVLERDNFLLYLLLLAATVYLLEQRSAEKPRSVPLYIICGFLLTLMFFAKFSTFTSGCAFLVLFVAYECMVGKNKAAIWLFAPSMVAMPICYLIYNPSLSNLIDYVVGILKISSGWMETQQYDFTVIGKDLVALISIVACYVILLVLALVTQHEKSGVIFACSASMFFVYKYATTRHGLACGIWLFGMIYSIIPLTIDFKALKENKGRIATVAIPIIALCITITAAFQANTVHNSFGNIKETLRNKAYNWTHLSESGIEDTIYGDYLAVSETLLEKIGSETVAVYPYKVSLKAAYPDLNVIHYPSVQNANEFIPWIDSKTAEWLDDPQKASSYLLINDETIDGHIKYLDAPLTWRSIQNNYSLVDYEGDWTLLKRKAGEAADYGELELISREVYTTWETIEVPKEADYAIIHTEYSFTGKIKKFLYHVYTLNMIIEYDDGTIIDGRVMTPNLESGFDMAFFPQSTEELVEYMSNGPQKRIEAIMLHGLGIKDLKDTIEVEWYIRK